MNIYIIRHGEAKKDSVFNFEGYPDADLTEVGLKQAQLTGKHISTVPFDAIYSSDLKRAMQTSDIISSYQQGLKVEIDKQIREINMGVFHTSSEEQIRKDYPEFYNEFLKKDTDFRYPEGESGEEVLRRTLNFLESVKHKKFNNICVVCHGGVIRSVISHFIGLPQHKRFNLYPFNCGISLLRYDGDNFKVISINEISHLGIYAAF
ncbi:histidine phosphatase family protein [Lutispora saccharofermentans]|uniref:Histidine phosphatase family protein n=1 Tax=Lutispora saccharofermentans TaxID=3024236 RepID=A0ABT1NFK5_9FIRM|nr:histidine phosphatase family protein [Lutispora saccharofermentans]MCQ1529946.1 histidine phosphatase family protein [Lutispora saccharofermentans]